MRVVIISDTHERHEEYGVLEGDVLFRHAHFLLDEAIEIDGVRFYGSPWVPYLRGWAFYADDQARAAHWAKIPADTDILITHTPPAGILDRDRGGYSYGCSQLRERLGELAPSLHCFGHIHASGGVLEDSPTTFVNASAVTRNQVELRPPVVLERVAGTRRWARTATDG